jgi:hypothetical protein
MEFTAPFIPSCNGISAVIVILANIDYSRRITSTKPKIFLRLYLKE